MKQPPGLIRRLFLQRLQQAYQADPQGWVLVEDLSREAFGLRAMGLPIAGPTANGTLNLRQRASVRRAIRAMSAEGVVEFAEQLPTERRRTRRLGTSTLRGHRRSIWARLASAEAPRRLERRELVPTADRLTFSA